MSINAQNISVDQAEVTSGGWYRTVVSGETISFPAAAQSASSFSFIIRNTGATTITLTGTPIVQISGTNASEFTCSQPALSSLTAGQSTTFTITYLPTALGLRTATLQIPNSGTPFQINLKGASFDLYGPKSPVPDGTASTDFTDGSNGKFGKAGGGNLYINAVTFGMQTNLYWGPNLSSTGDLGIKVSMNDDGIYQQKETLTFDAASSNLPAGIVVWKGSTSIQNAILGTAVNVLTRATMTATWFNGTSYTPIALIDPVTLGLSSQIGGLVKFDELTDYLRANILIEASTNGVTWTPYLDFYNAYPTPPGPLPGFGIGKAYSSFSSGYYWDNIDPLLTKNVTLNVNEGGTATIDLTKLDAKDLEDITLGYKTKSDIVFKVVTNNNGLATYAGNGNLKLSGATLSQNSTFTLQDIEDGKLTYTHDGSETTSDGFLFTFTDSKKELGDDGGNTIYNFQIFITAVNDAPVANDLSFNSSYAAALNGTLTASDDDSSVFTFSIVSNPASGTITNFNASTGTFTYTSTLGHSGTDSFTYQVSDGNTVSNIGTVTINIFNLPPTSQNESFTTEEDKPITGVLNGVDPENSTVYFQVDKQPNQGTINLNANGNFTYTPNASRFGYDSFLFSAHDQEGNTSASYKAIIHIIPRIDPGDALVVDKDLIRLYDPVTVQDTIITKNQGLQDALSVVYKKNVGLFAYDKNNGLIKINPLTGVQSLLSPKSNFTSSPPIGGPPGMAINSNNKILVTDASGILQVDPSNGNVTTLFSGGSINFPTGIVCLSNGDVLITDASMILGGSSKLIRITPQGVQSTVSTGNLITLPLDLSVINDNKVVISDAGSFAGATDNIYTVDLTTGTQTLLSTGGKISIPSGLDYWNGNVFVVNNQGSKEVIKIDANTGVQSVVTGKALSEPWGLFIVQKPISIENLQVTDTSCPNAQDGVINFTINGGTAPYYYSLDGGTDVAILSLPVSISNLQAKNYTLAIKDSSGDGSSANVVVNTLPDTQNPTITAPQAVSVPADNGSCVATNVVLGTPITADNCTGFTVTNNAPTSFPIGTTIVTWTVTDSSGNKATANQNVTVTDTQNPSITAPQTVSVPADNGSCVATNVTLGTPITADNCTGFTVTNNAPTSFPIGTTIVTWTVTDASGNKATANQNVTVTDTQKPIITAPQTVSVPADNGSCVATNIVLGTPTASDNCTGFTVTNNAPTSFPIGTTIVIWTVTDASGNKATANQNVIVADTQKPTITAPQAVSVPADNGSCVAANVVLGTPISADNCTGFTVTNNAPTSFPIGTTIVTWTVTDASGNKATANQNVIVADTQKPTITAPQAASVPADNGSCVATNVALGTPITADNCTGFTVTNNAPTSFPIGTTIVTWTVTDASGNKATANQNVTVTDTQKPTITAPQTVSVPADSGSCVATNVVLGTPTATDNCTGFIVTNNAPTSFPIGTTIVIWTVTDASGNKATANQNVIVADTQKPTITAPQAVSVPADNGSCVAANVALGTPISADNCTGFTVTNNAPTSFPIGTTVVIWTVTDASGNKATANQNVIVADTQKPTITAPQAASVPADNGSCVATNVTLGTPTVADNCTGFIVTNNAPTSFPIGTTVVTWTITDASGNKATATQNIRVTDTQNPTITAPQTVTVPTDNGSCVATNVALGNPTATDNCTGFTVINNAPTSFPIGTTNVTWTITDASGNKATATQSVIVNDLIAPNVPVSQTFCKGALVSDLATNGFNVIWYSTSTVTIPLPKTIALTNGTYYASNFNGTCESKTRTAVTVKINTTATPTGSASQQFCDGADLGDIVINGTNIKWYSSKTSSNSLPSTTVLVNQTKYYASQTDNTTGCESEERLEITVVVTKVPAPQGQKAYIFCAESNTKLLEINKNYSNVVWYDNNSRTNKLNDDYQLTNGDIIYGVSVDKQTGCESTEYLTVSIQILECELEIFNYITPDNNNQNEALVILNIEAFPKNNLQIFNRQGKAVFKVSGYGQDNRSFTGKSNINGETGKLPTGTYFYVLEYFSPVTSKSETKKGFLYINNND